ncbi:AbrB/MazE/SpoVT family DNA-binding domain-containing protein [Candidatus Woesearchaeota archaeon]|nr:AbrB/MazE/SpoVT family DNA-binding domain-containing protein [Candidatus Woesearchaeota archaeon]
MAKYPTLVQCDKRGQIVIPKNIRLELGINKKTGFIVYSVTKEGLLLKRVKLKK